MKRGALGQASSAPKIVPIKKASNVVVSSSPTVQGMASSITCTTVTG
jgi:hypothetical protein